ncbi:hypothetical protein J4734_07675 [Klebsiella pneumoniae]|uniref:Uncharacterized protein n=1 Tax=Klebsiella pneumoniae TaxID=573 RepID=A0A939SW29_KLEPN|nr:hypothetical protein [Klebsiella pneumoniae]
MLLAALWLATVGGDAAMIELEQLVAGYDGVAITPPLSGMICPGSLTALLASMAAENQRC